jgi:hypothetical protein
MTFWESFWLIVEAFFFFAYLVVLFHIVTDLFRDKSTGGFAKAVWVLFLVALPLLTALVYLLARGKGMAERQQRAVLNAEERAQSYIRDVAGASPAQQIATAKQLFDAGAIDATEFAALKASALAGSR